MTGPQVAVFLKMLATGRDNAPLRYDLAVRYPKNNDAVNAAEHED